jgi:hypothetical protein
MRYGTTPIRWLVIIAYRKIRQMFWDRRLMAGQNAYRHLYRIMKKFVIPAGNAGIQKPRMANAEYIPVLWIPAFPAGMTGKFSGKFA